MIESVHKLTSWSEELSSHKIPRWDSLPDIDLYMDQVITYMERQMSVFMNGDNDKIITPSMINNYVKDKLIPRPVQKKYSKEHLGYLLTVCMLKQVLPIPDISKLINHQVDKMQMSELYNSFCGIQDEALQVVSHRVKETLESASEEDSEDALSMLALKLAVEANASRIAAERILYVMEQQSAKTGSDGKKKESK